MSINRYFSALLSLLLIVLSLVACQTDGGAGESTSEPVVETDPVTETKPIIETEDTETTESEITQSMELNRYMRSLTKFFYEPCDKLDPKSFRDDILSLLFSFSYNYGEQLGFATWDEARADESLMVIQGEDLRKVGKILLGDDFNAWDYHDVLDWGEYIEENDTYEVSFSTDYWGENSLKLYSEPSLSLPRLPTGRRW